MDKKATISVDIKINEEDMEKYKNYSDQLKSQSEQLKELVVSINKTINQINELDFKIN